MAEVESLADTASTTPGATWECFREDDEIETKLALEAFLPVSEVQVSDSIDELLDQGDHLLQEFRGGNAALLERICTTESLRTLVVHATQPQRQLESGEPLSLDRLRRRSHTAAELLALCGPGSAQDDHWKLRVLQLFWEDATLLDLLWGFLLDLPVDSSTSSWNVLAGYFCGVVLALFHHLPGQVIGYLRTRGDAVFANFMLFLGTRCIAELFVALLLTESEEGMLFPLEGLMIRLVEQFQGARPDGDDADENLALVIKTLVSQACHGLRFGAAILEQISSANVVATLLDKVVDLGSPAAASVLSLSISRLFCLSPNPLLPMRGPNLMRPLEEETHQEIAEAERLGIADVSRALVQAICKELPRYCDALLGTGHVPTEGLQLPGSLPTERSQLQEVTKILLEAKGGELSQDAWQRFHALGDPEVEEVLHRDDGEHQASLRSELLAKLRRARAKLDEERLRNKMPQPRQVPFSGALAVEATLALVELARVQDSDVLQVFLEQELLKRCVVHLFVRPWGAVMLNTVGALCLELIRSPQSSSVKALCLFLEDGAVMGRVAKALKAVAQETHRDWYAPELTGLLRKILGELRDAGSTWSEVQERLDSLACWTEVVLPDLEEFAQLEQEPLGGFPKLDTPSFPMVNVDDVEFSPEDLRDLDEDLDTKFLLDLGHGQLQRQAQVSARKDDAELAHEKGNGDDPEEEGEAGEWV